MNFVYICRDGDNEELRYSIRSLCKNTESPEIWVVGGKPKWYSGNYIKIDQNHNKNKNALNNLKKIVSSKDIPNNFILMNDDFYIMKPIKSIPYYHGGKLVDKINVFEKNEPTSPYTKLLGATYDKLVTMGIKNPLDYAIHVPMKMNKSKLSKIIKPGLSIRTLYGNIYEVGGIEIKDVKLHHKREWTDEIIQIDHENIFLSTNDSSFFKIENMLKKEFDIKSDYELF